jgi:hypothetical protein
MRIHHAAMALLSLAISIQAHAGESDVSIEAPVSLFDTASIHDYGAPLMRGEDEEPQRFFEQRQRLAGQLEELLLEEVEAAGGSLHASGDELVVAGGPEVVDLVRRRVAAIDTFVQGKATIRVAAVHVDAVADATSAEAIRAAVSGGRARVLWSSRTISRRGEPVVRDATEETTFVGDFDVEVAVSSAIADPLVWSLITGWRISIQQRALDADRAFVSLAFHLSRIESMEPVEVGAGTFQRPRVPFVAATVPLVVRRGAPEVVFVDHPFEAGVLAVVVDVVELPSVPRLPYRLVDVAAHAGAGAIPRFVAVGLDAYAEDGPEPAPYAGASALLDRLVVADAGLPLTTTLIAVVDAAAELPQPRAQRLERVTWRDVTPVRLPGYDPLDGSLASESVEALRSTPANSHISLFALRGARTSCFSGTWTRAVTDFDVEIADTAAITDPIVYSFVEGDLFEISREDVSASGDVAIRWSAVRGLGTESMPIFVRKDIQGKRSEESVDRIDLLRHRSWSGRIVVTDDTPADVRLTGDTAEIDLWSRD